MAFERMSIVTFRPSSRKRTFSSRVPNRVSMLGLIPMLFFIQSLYDSRRNAAVATSQTKQDYASRRDQSGCACQEGGHYHYLKRTPRRSESQWPLFSDIPKRLTSRELV